MKRYNNLFEKVIEIDNLYLAEKKARKSKSNKIEIINYLKDLDDNILKLHYELRFKTYNVSEYYHFTIYETKERKISKLPYIDRIVHHAIMNVIGKILIDSFISQTYSCIKGRGIHLALKTLRKYIKNKNETGYVLKLDIKKFYHSIINEILKSKFRKKFKDKELLWLIDSIIDSHNGCPLGNFTSQSFANFYLSDFCHWLKEKKKVKYVLSYCDDFVILSSSKKELHNLRKEIQEYLKVNLELELSNYQVFPISKRGIDFLGYVSFSTHVKLRKRIKLKWIKMLKKYLNRKSKASYNGWLSWANTINLQNKYLKNGHR